MTLEKINEELKEFVRRTCPEFDSCLNEYLIDLKDGHILDLNNIEDFTIDYFYNDFLKYTKTILDNALTYVKSIGF